MCVFALDTTTIASASSAGLMIGNCRIASPSGQGNDAVAGILVQVHPELVRDRAVPGAGVRLPRLSAV